MELVRAGIAGGVALRESARWDCGKVLSDSLGAVG